MQKLPIVVYSGPKLSSFIFILKNIVHNATVVFKPLGGCKACGVVNNLPCYPVSNDLDSKW